MAYTYDPEKAAMRGKDQMRFELGDTQVNGGADACALCDEEYEAVLAGLKPGKRPWLKAKLAALQAIMFKLSYQVDTKIDVLSYGLGARAEQWRKLYDEVHKEEMSNAGLPTMDDKAEKKPPYFYTGMEHNPQAEKRAPAYPFRKATT